MAYDIFCGAGGASAGLGLAGFIVHGVDHRPQPNYFYPLCFSEEDALEVTFPSYVRFVWASPPCQKFSAYRRKGHGVGDDYPDLIDAVRRKLLDWGGPFVIENVPGAPLRKDLMLCGSMFGLDVRRHRWFEIHGFDVPQPECRHDLQTPRFPPATNRTNLRKTVEIGVWRIPLQVQRDAMGIPWMSLKELSQAVPPAYARHIGEAFMSARSP